MKNRFVSASAPKNFWSIILKYTTLVYHCVYNVWLVIRSCCGSVLNNTRLIIQFSSAPPAVCWAPVYFIPIDPCAIKTSQSQCLKPGGCWHYSWLCLRCGSADRQRLCNWNNHEKSFIDWPRRWSRFWGELLHQWRQRVGCSTALETLCPAVDGHTGLFISLDLICFWQFQSFFFQT